MKKQEIIRAWKDEEFRLSLSPEQLAQLPENPAGVVELSDDDVRSAAVVGAGSNQPCICAFNTCD